MKKVRYLFEFLIAFILIKFFRFFPIWLASNICGFIVKHIMYFVGRFTEENKKGIRQIGIVFPLINEKERIKLLKSSYENIGRFIAEYINQDKMTAKWFKQNVEIINGEYLIEQAKKGCFIFSCHFGNWEIIHRFLMLNGVNLSAIYNPLQNSYINKIYLKQREINQIPKGSVAMKQVVVAIKQKQSVIVLIDQRDKAGELFKFFNQDAKTSTAIQRLCIKHKYNMVPFKCERSFKNKNKFIFTIFPALETDNQNKPEDALIHELTNKSMKTIESWILQNPENWLLWTYSRWKIKFN